MTYAILAVCLVVFLIVSFVSGRRYERKQFVRIGKKRPTTQDVLLGGKK